MEQKTKRNHYIPKHFLKGFCCEDDENMIWVYDKQLRKTYRTNIKNAAVEKNFYDEEGEEFYANSVEGSAIEPIKKIRNRVLITPEDKKVMAKYFVYLHTRNPATREIYKKILPEIQSSVKQNLIKKLVNRGLFAEDTEKKIDAIQSNDGFKENTLRQPITVESMEYAFMLTTWFYIEFRCEEDLIICDNPIYFNNPDGCFKKSYAWVVPISSKILLNGMWSDQSDQFIMKDKQLLRASKKRIVKNAIRFVYSSTRQDDWIENYLKKLIRASNVPL
jgi:hypothetical protein